MLRKLLSSILIIALSLTAWPGSTVKASAENSFEVDRQALFEKMDLLTGVPWYYLAAMDQYERNIQRARPGLKERKGLVSIIIPPKRWSGMTNPDPFDTVPESIRFFGGIGRDGNGDGKADATNAADVLYTVTQYLSRHGATEDDIRIALWEYYQHPVSVDLITHIAKIYRHFGTTELNKKSFIMPLRYNYTYHNTWGDRRGWGGLRIHEGTDIFADYGTPVKSTSYGYVELKGWNRYGGWRIGIRDIRNNYHYYAHLSRYSKGLKKGDVVQPGQVIGFVGSTGYGPPGTSGKFPPHLHYGMYKFNGRNTFSFDPYPFLKAWERSEYKQLRQKKKIRK
ncbi:MAG: M23 family metallopeptidase [Firmicutes bacterium]|uniref:Murein DD-endopeptidase MepM and murein hydrolase activator NlpD, contain LysM domain n=1 Tax=Melghirimyces thermohalophilus TaxID=1236220 RepID=A0A1G6L2F0_9BACL|nr:M23 family metallopeptidase [Melghirimyces thermohalophilus]MDA8353084.1 M23 family metallopeptidase [Bacillota bacterium]SDC37492.1 Murein DD-endopeptidase MepM and murein hydrolase activator NlpD, contain LysM domain [Melghirimyces thermohalophilus]